MPRSFENEPRKESTVFDVQHEKGALNTDKLVNKHAGDVDLSWDALHHTLGTGPTQAAPGNHKHSIGDIQGYEKVLITDHQALSNREAVDAHSQYALTGHTHTPYNNAYIRANRTGHALSVTTWAMGTGWYVDYAYGISIGGSSFSVPAGVYIISVRMLTPSGGRAICGVDSNDNAYNTSNNWLFETKNAVAGDTTAGSIIIPTSTWLRVWFYVGTAQSINYWVDIAKVGVNG